MQCEDVLRSAITLLTSAGWSVTTDGTVDVRHLTVTLDHTRVKRCSKCRQIKGLDAFTRSKQEPDGRHGHCRECRSSYDKIRNATWGKARNQHKARQARAKRVGAKGFHTIEQLEARMDYWGRCCWVCRESGQIGPYEEVDHVIPLSPLFGGTDWPANLRPICRKHNTERMFRRGDWMNREEGKV